MESEIDHPGTTAEAPRYRTLLEVNNAIISSLAEADLFRAIASALRRVMPLDRSAIFLHDRARDVLRLTMLESSVASPYFAVGLEMPPGESHVGRVFQTRQPLVRRDILRERAYAMEDRALADGIRSFIIVPLLARGKCLGTLAVASRRPDQYGDADAALLQEVATQVALAVENMQAYREIDALRARLERENVYLQEEIGREHHFDEMVGSSPALLALLHRVEQVAPTDATVLVTGETGTGKELIARALHARSGRHGRALVKVNCSALSAGLVESELFGHVKGAFTGALARRAGRFEIADGGTLFLDEVGDLPLDTQVKLLRVLQEQEFEPVGSSTTVRVDVRVIAATNRDLGAAVAAGRFRPDLFYRLNVFPLAVPPLRDRRADIPQLTMFFVARFARRFGKPVETISDESLARLVDYPWPGNIRELQHVIERAVILATGPVLKLEADLLPAIDSPAPLAAAGPSVPALTTLEDVERDHILKVLRHTRGVVEGSQGAARLLGLHPNTLRSRLAKLGIKRPPHGIS